MNKKTVAALIPSMMIVVLFIIGSFRVMMRYWETPANWHFIFAAMGGGGFMFLLGMLSLRIIRLNKEQNV